MLQIVYISTSREVPSAATLESILDASRRNNERSGVTGLLVSGGRRFLQAIEGPSSAILETFAAIRSDRRHFALVQLGCTAIEERAFGHWAMAHQAGGAAEQDVSLARAVEALVSQVDDKALRAQFVGFVDMHCRAA